MGVERREEIAPSHSIYYHAPDLEACYGTGENQERTKGSAMYLANAEPSLDELLDDPITQLRMMAAQLRPEEVRACLMEARRWLRDRHESDGSGAGRTTMAQRSNGQSTTVPLLKSPSVTGRDTNFHVRRGMATRTMQQESKIANAGEHAARFAWYRR
jgi:hypothetical protein